MTGGWSEPDVEPDVVALLDTFFAREAPIERQQAMAEPSDGEGFDRELHTHMAELGFFTQSLPPALGGIGASKLASCLVAEAAGARLVPGPWLDQLVAVDLLAAGSPGALEPYASGQRLVSLVVGGPGVHWDPRRRTLSGPLPIVRFGRAVERWLVVTPTAPTGAFLVDPSAPGVREVAAVPSLDPLWRSVAANLDAVTPEAAVAYSSSSFDAVVAHAGALVAAFSIGAAQATLDLATSHVKQRRQFGVPVGSFQAVKHRAADCLIDVVHARALARSAMQQGDLHDLVVARVAADRCFRHVAEAALQMHGGVGFTTEVPVHLYLKSAHQLRSWPRPVGRDLELLRARLQVDPSEVAS